MPSNQTYGSQSMLVKPRPSSASFDEENRKVPPPKAYRPSSVLLTSALDCAIVGTSSQIVDKLHSVDGPMQHNHVPNNVNYNSLDRSSLQDRSRNPPHATAVRENPLESKQFSNMNAEPPSFMRNNASARNSVQRERPKRFTELLDSTVVNDHFDQYGTISSQCSETSSYYGAVPPHEDSGLGGLTPDDYSPGYSDDVHMNGAQEPMTPMSPPIPLPVVPNQQQLHHQQQPPYQKQQSYQQGNHHPHHYQPSQQQQQQQQQQHQQQLQSNTLPNPNKVDDTAYNATARPLSRPTQPNLQRRKTLPSIIKRPPTIGESKPAPKTSPSAAGTKKATEPTKEEETFIIENGVRKRIKAEVYQTPPSPSSSAQDDDKPKELPKRYKIEPSSNLRRIANRGSLPDVSACKELPITPRAEMSVLSAARRAELLKLQEEEELRKQQEIVLRLTDLKVCTRAL